jgi:hypothetical protein
MEKMQALYELMKMAERLSPRAQYCLNPTEDDLTPYFTHNHEIELYHSLLLKAELAHLFGLPNEGPKA